MEQRWRDGERILTQAFSFNGEPQAKESAANDGCGLPRLNNSIDSLPAGC